MSREDHRMTMLQTQFPIRAERYCVLLTPHSVRDRLPDFDLDEDSVTLACEQHWLAPALDIGLQSTRQLRIAPSALAFFDLTGGARSRRVTDDEFFAELFRGLDLRLPWLTGERARALLNCGGTHINRLVDSGELDIMPGTERRPGPDGSDRIKISSLKSFLKRRLL